MGQDLTGGCACGAVRYTASGAPRFSFICQCRDCQHQTGAGHSVQFCHDRDAFAVEGELASWSRQTESGSTVENFVCATCFSPIYGTTTRGPATLMAQAGSLDDPSAIKPDRVFFSASAQPWDHASVPAKED